MNPIDAVKERLDGGRLWLQGSLGEWQLLDTEVCLIGAMCSVAGTDEIVIPEELRTVIQEQYPELFGGVDLDDVEIESFNDDVCTAWPDVERVLEKASALWSEHRGIDTNPNQLRIFAVARTDS